MVAERQAYCCRITAEACDIRYHRSFVLPPNPGAGRDRPLRVSYADAGYNPQDHQNADETITYPTKAAAQADAPVLVWSSGQFGGRYQACAYDELAKQYKIRLIAIDRPGIGGSESVPLQQRISTWLEILPALLEHLDIKHVHLAAHSAGTVYTLSTILHLRHLLYPNAPYAALFGPWVHPANSGKWQMSTVSYLPGGLIGQWHHAAKFINSNIAPLMAASGMAITKASRVSTDSSVGPDEDTTGAGLSEAAGAKTLRIKAAETLLTKYLFAENVEGGGQDALLCMRKGVDWGECTDLKKAAAKIAGAERARQADSAETKAKVLRLDLYFAEKDEMIGKGGQAYLERCFNTASKEGGLDYHPTIVKGTDHNGVTSANAGGVEALMRVIGTQPIGTTTEPQPNVEGVAGSLVGSV